VGDPIWPEPLQISLPRLIDGAISVRGYPLEMVLAEKIVTALERGTANTRWRDFVDIYVLTRHYQIDAQTLESSMQRVAQFRGVVLTPLRTALAGYPRLLSHVGSPGCGSNASTTRFRRSFRLPSRARSHLPTG
jgi:hypothetical protein